MVDPLLLYFFSESLQKEATTVGDLARGAAAALKPHLGKEVLQGAIAPIRPHVAEFGKEFLQQALAPIQALHPTGKYIRKAYSSLSNVSPRAKKEMATWMGKETGRAAENVIDFEKGKGAVNAMRRGGWLSGYARYEGDKVLPYVKNRLLRMAPGQRAFAVIPSAVGAYHDLKEKEDPSTGRKKGIAERLTSAGVGFGSGIISSRMPSTQSKNLIAPIAGQMAGQVVGSRVGSEIGRRSGKAIDDALRKRKEGAQR